MTLNEDVIQKELLYHSLSGLGSYYELDMNISVVDYQEQIKRFKNDWVQYNPRKKNNPRYGLSLTSLDGEMSGYPDLDSIREYNIINNTDYNDSSFTKHTKALKELSCINEPLIDFLPYLGRSHLLRFDEGGYFPFHRDSHAIGTSSFRILAPIEACGPCDYAFIFNRKKIELQPGQLYYMDTKMEHALFSFADNMTFLVLNVLVCEEAIRLTLKHLMSK